VSAWGTRDQKKHGKTHGTIEMPADAGRKRFLGPGGGQYEENTPYHRGLAIGMSTPQELSVKEYQQNNVPSVGTQHIFPSFHREKKLKSTEKKKRGALTRDVGGNGCQSDLGKSLWSGR